MTWPRWLDSQPPHRWLRENVQAAAKGLCSVVEACIGKNKMKQCRRVAIRYDKLAANYLAFVQLVSGTPWLRVNERVQSLQ